MQIRKFLTLLVIGLSFIGISCKGTAGGDSGGEGDPNAGKTEVSYSVFINHLLAEDGNAFTKDNVIVTATFDDGTTGRVKDFTIVPETFDVYVGSGVTFTFIRGGESTNFVAYKAEQDLSSIPTKNGETITFGYFAKSKLESTAGMTFSAEPARNGWYIGSDGNYYGKAGNDYYKVEPIEWDIYTDKFNNNNCYENGSKLLLVSKDIIYGGIPYSESTQERTIKGKTIYSNNYEYSNLRAFLNGKTLYLDDGSTSDKYKNFNFLNMAFTDSAKNKILTTTVKNDGNSSNDPTNPNWSRIDGTKNNDENGNPKTDPTGKTDYTCSDTQDKVFALSIYDCTNKDYGVASGCDGNSSNLYRKVTAFSKALGVENDADEDGNYMIRTPYYSQDDKIRYVKKGHCYQSDTITNLKSLGIVPAIVIDPLN